MRKGEESEVFLVQKLNEFTNEFLSELEKTPRESVRKLIARRVLLVFLGNYLCFAKGDVHTKCKELMIYFSSSINDVQENEHLDLAIQDLVNHMFCVMNALEDKESVIRTIVLELICLYSGLAISDMGGIMRCSDLGEQLFPDWEKTKPMRITLLILKEREKNSNLPFEECKSLEKYSF